MNIEKVNICINKELIKGLRRICLLYSLRHFSHLRSGYKGPLKGKEWKHLGYKWTKEVMKASLKSYGSNHETGAYYNFPTFLSDIFYFETYWDIPSHAMTIVLKKGENEIIEHLPEETREDFQNKCLDPNLFENPLEDIFFEGFVVGNNWIEEALKDLIKYWEDDELVYPHSKSHLSPEKQKDVFLKELDAIVSQGTSPKKIHWDLNKKGVGEKWALIYLFIYLEQKEIIEILEIPNVIFSFLSDIDEKGGITTISYEGECVFNVKEGETGIKSFNNQKEKNTIPAEKNNPIPFIEKEKVTSKVEGEVYFNGKESKLICDSVECDIPQYRGAGYTNQYLLCELVFCNKKLLVGGQVENDIVAEKFGAFDKNELKKTTIKDATIAINRLTSDRFGFEIFSRPTGYVRRIR